MSYLNEFLKQIHTRNFQKFLVLWEEYSMNDTVDTEEFIQLLKAIKNSDFAERFGKLVENALPLWKLIENQQDSYEVLRLLVDLQTVNTPAIGDLVMQTLQNKYGTDPKYNERLRLIGLRNKDSFQHALSKYDLVSHFAKSNMVFHNGGWGTGEIVEVSFIREHVVIEFENVAGRKDLSFANAFKTLIPLSADHFLARRFANPDLLEQEGCADPLALIKLLLRDMGPKTAGEIKDELCELVIPEKDWTKWWQGARSKCKKDSMIATPETLKEPFYLRKASVSAEQRFQKNISDKTDINQLIQTNYSFVRDTPQALKNTETKEMLQQQLKGLLENPQTNNNQQLQIYLLLEQFFDFDAEEQIAQRIRRENDLEGMITAIDVIALKKRALVAIKDYREDWVNLFLKLLLKLPQTQLRDYLLRELNQTQHRALLERTIQENLLDDPKRYPEIFIWYFQKLVNSSSNDLPFQNPDDLGRFFENFFILFQALETQPSQRVLLRKMYTMISSKRYELIRELLQGKSLEYTKEFLLLVSKCQSLTDHDVKILRSLAEVVHPSLAPIKQRKGAAVEEDGEILTTAAGYLKIQERIRHIGTVEVIDNAKEIEAARALGDLRENSEFKFAQERRARLQTELKTLSKQLNQARIMSAEDVPANEVGFGCIVKVNDAKGNASSYTILGPWDADPEQNILSFNSKFVQTIIGKKIGEKFLLRDEEFCIVDLKNFFNN